MAFHPTHAVSVCSGYGGIDLGLGLALGGSCRTILYCEREAFAAAVLVSQMAEGHLDAAPVWSDLATLPAMDVIHALGVDPAGVVMHGGIPCQPWSGAGKKLGARDERWLWPVFWNIVQKSGVGWLFLENVRGFVSGGDSGLEFVLRDLSRAGWDAEWDLFSAADCGAPHLRERLFLLAHAGQGGCGQEYPELHVQRWQSPLGGRRNVADAGGTGQKGGEWRETPYGEGETTREPAPERGFTYWPAGPGQQQLPGEPPRLVVYPCKKGQAEPGLGGDTDGTADQVDAGDRALWAGRISSLGNGVVPVVVGLAYLTLHGRLMA